MSRVKLKPISEQVVVIIGASSGIGRATALAFAEEGANLVIAARKGEALDALAIELGNYGVRVVTVAMDTSNYEQVESVADEAILEFGRIDTWVQNAGVGIFAKFEDMMPEEFARVIEINLLGSAYGAMVALKYLKRQGGALIAVSSIESEVGAPYQSAYAASKHGMKGFLDVLRIEMEHDRCPVSITNIKPAAISTPFYSSAYNKTGFTPHAVAPVYPPEKVADAILYAAHVPRKDVIVGGAGVAMILMKRLMPSVMDWMLARFGFKAQMAREAPRTSGNLYTPVADTRIHGDAKPAAA